MAGEFDGVPETRVQAGEQGPLSSLPDVGGVALVIGCGDGIVPAFQPVEYNTLTDVADFSRAGSAAHLLARIVSGGRRAIGVRLPVSVPGTLSSVSKAYGNPLGATILILGGWLYTTTRDPKAHLFIRARRPGLFFGTYNTGPSKPLKVNILDGRAVEVQLQTDAAAKSSTTAKMLLDELNKTAPGLLDVSYPFPGSDGSGLVLEMGNTLALDNGALQLKARKRPGAISLAAQPMKNGKLAVTFDSVTNKIGILYATDGDGVMASSTLDVFRELTANADIVREYEIALPGTGQLQPPPNASELLPFGSTGDATITGVPLDRFQFTLRCTKAGTVGSVANSPDFAISYDDADSMNPQVLGGTYGAPQPVPLSGALSLSNDIVRTGLTATLTGSFDVNDRLRFESFEGSYLTAHLGEGLEVAYKSPDLPFGFVVPTGPTDYATAAVVDAVVQTAAQPPVNRFTYALLNLPEMLPGESYRDYAARMLREFGGATPFISNNGHVSLFENEARFYNPQLRIYQRRPLSMVAAVLRTVRPVHEQLGNRNSETGPGPLIKYGVQTIYRDAASFPTLIRLGFTSASVVVGKGWFFTEWLTRAVKTSVYRAGPINAIMCGVARQAVITGSESELDTGATDPATGALSNEERATLANNMTVQIGRYLYTVNIDNKTSGVRNPPSQPLVEVPIYNAYETEELRYRIQFYTMVTYKRVLILLNVAIPLGGA